MTHIEDLIHRLRDTASRGVSSWGDLQQEAADELLGMWKRIEANERFIQMMSEQLSAERLATELAVDAEREACAKVCESEWSNAAEREFGEQCAAIIRGRVLRGQA